jgi:hypothetical protein
VHSLAALVQPNQCEWPGEDGVGWLVSMIACAENLLNTSDAMVLVVLRKSH